MKHGRKHPRHLPAHVQAVLDLLRRKGAEIVEVVTQRTIMIRWRLGSWLDSIRVDANTNHPEELARTKCACVEARFARRKRVATC